MNKFELRPEQERCYNEALPLLQRKRWAYLVMEVRTGKTHTALALANTLKPKNLLFVTTKKTIESGTIIDDYDTQGCDFHWGIINYESLHKLKDEYDFVIWDEAHLLGAFPKSAKRARAAFGFKKRAKYNLFMSGTPTPESYSQWFHQLIGVANNPIHFPRFYGQGNTFAKKYVEVEKKYRGAGQTFDDYSNCSEEVNDLISPFMVFATQKSSGFTTSVDDEIVTIPMSSKTKQMIANLKSDKFLEIDGDLVLADTGVKEMGKIHQLCGGTVKSEMGVVHCIDTFKRDWIAENCGNDKIAVFYKYVGEHDMLMTLPNFTDDLQTFYNDPSKSLCIHYRSGSKGISLKQADYMVMFNIDFSAEMYIQARNRLTTKERLDNRVVWLFSDYGLEQQIFNAVRGKQEKFTLQHYKRLKL